MTTAWEYFKEGNWIDSIITQYTGVLGDWFYLIIGLIIITGIQLKTESIEATSIVMILLGSLGSFYNYFPKQGTETANLSIGLVWTFMMAIGIGVLWYKWYKQ